MRFVHTSAKMSSRIVDLRGKKPVRPKPAAHVPTHALSGRPSPVRVRRRQRRILVTAIVFALVASSIGAISYASYVPRFSVQSITVSGAQAVPQDSIRAYVNGIIYDGSRHILSRADIFLYPRAVIERDLVADFPRIASASVSRPSLFSNVVTVEVKERTQFAQWCPKQGTCYSMDSNGFIFAQSDTATSSGAYQFSGALADESAPIGKTFAPGHLSGLAAFLDTLGQAGYAASSAQLSGDQDFIVPLSSGYSVYASFGESPSTLVDNLKLVLSSADLTGKVDQLSYVDLRFGDRVYFKLKGEKQQTDSSVGTSTSTSTPKR